jgi:protein-tyrosine phosphatase
VLFVCVGNVCRSPVGERLLAVRLPAERFVVSSAGVSALVGHAMSRYAAEELRSYGGDPTGFTARRLTADMVEHSDLVLAATRELRAQVLADVPAAFRRTFTVLEFAALVGRAEGATPAELVAWSALHRSIAGSLEHDVPDPYRRGADEHARSARALDAAVQQIAKGLDR